MAEFEGLKLECGGSFFWAGNLEEVEVEQRRHISRHIVCGWGGVSWMSWWIDLRLIAIFATNQVFLVHGFFERCFCLGDLWFGRSDRTPFFFVCFCLLNYLPMLMCFSNQIRSDKNSEMQMYKYRMPLCLCHLLVSFEFHKFLSGTKRCSSFSLHASRHCKCYSC